MSFNGEICADQKSITRGHTHTHFFIKCVDVVSHMHICGLHNCGCSLGRSEGARADVQRAVARGGGAHAQRVHPRVQRRLLPPDALAQAALLPGPRVPRHAGTHFTCTYTLSFSFESFKKICILLSISLNQY